MSYKKEGMTCFCCGKAGMKEIQRRERNEEGSDFDGVVWF
jgi:hypothetical protein